jgi:hypothetical protein
MSNSQYFNNREQTILSELREPNEVHLWRRLLGGLERRPA